MDLLLTLTLASSSCTALIALFIYKEVHRIGYFIRLYDATAFLKELAAIREAAIDVQEAVKKAEGEFK